MKKFFPILIVLIICVIFGTFVACNNNDEKEVALRSDMTIDEVKEVLKDVKSLTMQVYYEDGTVIYESKVAKNGRSLIADTGYEVDFFEENIFYHTYLEDGDEGIEVVDCSGYDVVDYLQDAVEYVYDLMTEHGYTIKDNAITIEEKYEGEVQEIFTYIVKDFNTTKFEPYGKYKDTYKTIQPNTSVLEYEDLDDNSCALRKINVPLKSLQIPEKYNGKTVTEVEYSGTVPQRLTISKSVKELGGLYEGCHIIYLGTKEEFRTNVRTGYSTAVCDVECTDGTIKRGDSLIA